MSIKIYSGYRIRGKSFGELVTLFQELSVPILERATKEMQDAICERAITAYDISVIDGNPMSYAWANSWKKFRDEIGEILKTKHRNPRVDWSCFVTIYPLDADVLAYFDCEQRSLESIWQQHPWVEEYGYWNSTDKPEDISEEEWKQRGVDWQKVIEQSKRGFKWTFVDDHDTPWKLPKELPKLDDMDRSRRVAEDKHQSPKDWDGDAAHYICSSEYRAAIDREAMEILPQLPAITRESLR